MGPGHSTADREIAELEDRQKKSTLEVAKDERELEVQER